jgi:long-chain acyl-CoA synthetase
LALGRRIIGSPYEQRPWLKNYPERLPSDFKEPQVSALAVFEESALRYPEASAIHYFDGTITYRELNSLANSFGVGLAELGLRKGDRVIFQLQNMPQFLVAQYAAWKLGAIVVPLNPMYKEKELEYFFNNCGARVLVTMESLYTAARGLVGKTPLEKIITTSEVDFLSPEYPVPHILEGYRRENPGDAIDMMELLGKYQGVALPREKVAPDDIAHLIYTSGTTGPPKGAINTNRNIVFNAHVYKMEGQLDRRDKVLALAPFFHVTGTIAHLAIASLLGIPVIISFRFEPGEVLRLIEKWRPTMTVGSITVFFALKNHPYFSKRDLSSLSKVWSGGAAVPAAFVESFKQATRVYIHNIYGLTETTSPSHVTPIGIEPPLDSESGALAVGLPVPSCHSRIVDAETGTTELPIGELGEVIIKGPMVTPGYWGNPEETAHAIRQGWLYTGDIGKMDEDGWFYIIDRKKDLINVSGFKVWPRDVEDVLYQHPAVREACVVGIPDSYRGETVKAFVSLAENQQSKVTPDDLIQFCKQRMAAYKYPRIVEILPELPKTLTGKMLRRQLRAEGKSMTS